MRNDTLFLGLTRQPMILGVTYMYVFLNLFLSLMLFVMTSDFRVALGSAVIHGLAYMICLREPLLIELFLMRQRKFSKCPNKKYYGFRNTYTPI